MRVLVFGAGGFIGSRLAAQLAAQGRIGARRLDELVLFDQGRVLPPPGAACKVTIACGDVRDASAVEPLFAAPVQAVFHLAATLTLAAESDFRGGLETNVLALIDLLERCRGQAPRPLLLFASSISTFGGALPEVVDDDVFQSPTTSYGTHKAVAELLLSDYSRQGFIDGRGLRLPIVLTHPGPSTGSISDQVAALIREPLRGQRATCRMLPDSKLVVASVDNVVRSFLHLAALPAEALQEARTINLPALTVTPAQIVQAVERRLPRTRNGAVDWRPDAQVQRIVDGWPQGFTSRRALALGLSADASTDSVVDAFLAAEAIAA